MADDQISPELVMVDPELGEQARADLPWAAADVPWAEALPPVPAPSAAPARLERPKTGFTIAATLWLFGAVAVAVTLVVELLPDRGPRPSLAPALSRTPTTATKPAPAASPSPPAAKPRVRKATPAPAAVQPAAPRPQPPPAARPKPKAQSKPKAEPQRRPQPRRPPPAAVNPKPKPQPQPKTQRRPPPAAAAPPAKRRAPPPAFQPARVFAWAPHPGASYYHVVIRRDGRLFYEGWPREARLEIPGRFRFGPGQYTWRVEPGTGERSARQLGPPIVESSFTIPG